MLTSNTASDSVQICEIISLNISHPRSKIKTLSNAITTGKQSRLASIQVLPWWPTLDSFLSKAADLADHEVDVTRLYARVWNNGAEKIWQKPEWLVADHQRTFLHHLTLYLWRHLCCEINKLKTKIIFLVQSNIVVILIRQTLLRRASRSVPRGICRRRFGTYQKQMFINSAFKKWRLSFKHCSIAKLRQKQRNC